MSIVSFKKGALANLPEAFSAGTFYVTTDERALYLDVDGEHRIRIGDFQEFATIDELSKNVNPSQSALYYITSLNCLAKWNGTSYIQINMDTGATEFEVAGTGNAVTSVSYDEQTRKLTLTKGETFATKDELDAIGEQISGASSAVDDITIAKSTAGVLSIKGFTDAAVGAQLVKTDGGISWVLPSTDTVDGIQSTVATLGERTSNLETRMGAAESAIDAIEADYLNAADKADLVSKIATAKQEAITAVLDGVSEDFDTLKEVADWIASDTTNSSQLISRVSAIESDYLKGADKTTLQGEIDALETLVGTIPEGATSKTVVSYITEVVNGLSIGDYAKASELTALAGRVTAAEGKITALEGASHTHANMEEISKIATGDVAKWNAAQANAEATAASALENAKTELAAADAQVLVDAKAYADSLTLEWGEF